MRSGQDDRMASAVSHSRANELQSRVVGCSPHVSLALIFYSLRKGLSLALQS